MLKKVIKRNGSIENADASKVNGWMEALSQDLKDRLDWSSVVMEVFRECPEEMTSQDLQMALSKKFVGRHTWVDNLMGGRLFAIWHWKNLFGDTMPTLRTQHKQMQALGLMEELGYTDDEFEQIEALVDHQRDLRQAQFQLKQNIYKYGLYSHLTGRQEETPQYVYMRMAMALGQMEPAETKIQTVKDYYDYFSLSKMNAPTPNFTNLGTPHRGYASCCLITADDTAPSLAAAEHITYTMTYMSAGIGRYLNTRSLDDPIKQGRIAHQGKMPYFNAGNGNTKANLQGGRGGAAAEYATVFDPEIETIIMAQNPLTAPKKQQRGVQFNIILNGFFVEMAVHKQQYFTFNIYTAPDLHEALFSPDILNFIRLYREYEANPNFVKNYKSAWDIGVMLERQGHEVSTLHQFDAYRANVNTPFRLPVRQSNLCGEIVNLTKGYPHAGWLYQVDHKEGEVGICNIGGVVVANIKNDDEYFKACYLQLKMIDTTIDLAHYELPHIGYMAKGRRNAAIGVVGAAEVFAKRGIRIDTEYGREFVQKMAERHLFFVLKAALKLTEERGVCDFNEDTKWGDGWLPFDNYAKGMDEVVKHKLHYDWDWIRSELRRLGGLRFSTLIAHMPTESSSKAAGKPNGLYLIRELYMKKTDMGGALDWVAPDDDLYGPDYQIAYGVSTKNMYAYYGIWQKFCDQSISADVYEDRVKNPILTEEYLIENLAHRTRYGVVTKYYQVSLTTSPEDLDAEHPKPPTPSVEEDDFVRAECVGACQL